MEPSVTLSFDFPGGLLSPGISLFYLCLILFIALFSYLQGERLRQQVLKFTDPPLIKDRKVSNITRLLYRNIAISCINIRIVIHQPGYRCSPTFLCYHFVKKGSYRDMTLPR